MHVGVNAQGSCNPNVHQCNGQKKTDANATAMQTLDNKLLALSAGRQLSSARYRRLSQESLIFAHWP
jgi:hypothetical protein